MNSSHITVVAEGPFEVRLHDPAARCARCDAPDTIGLALRPTGAMLGERFCAACWPSARAELEAENIAERERWHAEWIRAPWEAPMRQVPWQFWSREWSHLERFFGRLIAQALAEQAPVNAELEAAAAEILRLAPQMVGAMPPDVAAFVGRYGRTAP